MVKVKGSSLKTSVARARKMFGDEAFKKAISPLSEEEKRILDGKILENDWISLDIYVHWLEREVKELLNGDEYQLEVFSEQGSLEHLSGIYKFFIRFGSPEFIIKRSATIMNQYFQGLECEVTLPEPLKAILTFTGLERHHRLYEYVILGFCKKAAELTGGNNVRAEITKSVGNGSNQSEITITWDSIKSAP
jgi:hypothetical protein